MKAYKLYITDPPNMVFINNVNGKKVKVEHKNFETMKEADECINELEQIGQRLTLTLMKHGRVVKAVTIPRPKPKLLEKF